jgi:glutaminyl-tRNA synthetase
LVRCTHIVKDEAGNVTEVHCAYDPATKGGDAPDGRKVKSTIHWVSAAHAVKAEARLYNQLFTVERPDDGDLDSIINPKSLEALTDCYVEPALKTASLTDRIQFERTGYFYLDLDSTPEKLVFNRTVTLKDSWAKEQKKG